MLPRWRMGTRWRVLRYDKGPSYKIGWVLQRIALKRDEDIRPFLNHCSGLSWTFGVPTLVKESKLSTEQSNGGLGNKKRLQVCLLDGLYQRQFCRVMLSDEPRNRNISHPCCEDVDINTVRAMTRTSRAYIVYSLVPL